MAEICGIHRSTWGYYETGRLQANDKALKKVAKHFGVSVLELTTWPVGDKSGRVKGRPYPNSHPRSATLSSPVLHIQSQTGKGITVEEIMEKVPEGVEHVYVKAEEERAYWVKGGETGVVELF